MTEAQPQADTLTGIVTRSGDHGETQLGPNRVPKNHPRIEAYGNIDELNSLIGVLRADLRDEQPLNGWLRAIQNDLFQIGADLDMIQQSGGAARFGAEPVSRLEAQLVDLHGRQPALRNFILPTGISAAAAHTHLARSVARRAERSVVALSQLGDDDVNPEIQRYLNRLSDLLFVIARHLNGDGAHDEVWTAGRQG